MTEAGKVSLKSLVKFAETEISRLDYFDNHEIDQCFKLTELIMTKYTQLLEKHKYTLDLMANIEANND